PRRRTFLHRLVDVRTTPTRRLALPVGRWRQPTRDGGASKRRGSTPSPCHDCRPVRCRKPDRCSWLPSMQRQMRVSDFLKETSAHHYPYNVLSVRAIDKLAAACRNRAESRWYR